MHPGAHFALRMTIDLSQQRGACKPANIIALKIAVLQWLKGFRLILEPYTLHNASQVMSHNPCHEFTAHPEHASGKATALDLHLVNVKSQAHEAMVLAAMLRLHNIQLMNVPLHQTPHMQSCMQAALE